MDKSYALFTDCAQNRLDRWQHRRARYEQHAFQAASRKIFSALGCAAVSENDARWLEQRDGVHDCASIAVPGATIFSSLKVLRFAIQPQNVHSDFTFASGGN